MRRLVKSTMAGVLGLGALVLLPGPSLAAGDQFGTARAPIQLAHMGPGPASQEAERPCPMGSNGPGMMGLGTGAQAMIGRRMIGRGMGAQGMMAPKIGMGPATGDRVVRMTDLTVEDVRHFFQHRVEMQGNARLTVGEVKEVDDDKIVAEITTVDGSLVQRFEVDRHSGQMQQVE